MSGPYVCRHPDCAKEVPQSRGTKPCVWCSSRCMHQARNFRYCVDCSARLGRADDSFCASCRLRNRLLAAEDGVLRIQLGGRRGPVRGFALIDIADAPLADLNWALTAKGYVSREVRAGGRRKVFVLHREICGLAHGDPLEVDHIDGDPLNNRRSNLRICTHAENGQNQPSQVGASSRYRGVSWLTKEQKWCAQARLAGQLYLLGKFTSEEKAAEAAAAWRVTHMPFTNEARSVREVAA